MSRFFMVQCVGDLELNYLLFQQTCNTKALSKSHCAIYSLPQVIIHAL